VTPAGGARVAIAGAAVAAVAVAAAGVWMRSRIVVVRVSGESMEPTLRGGDRVVVRRIAADRLRTGQIVVLASPYRRRSARLRDGHWVIKRLAGLPGDPVWTDVVPAGHAVVLGDNAARSTDSREFGPVPLDRILGVVVRRYADDAPIVAHPPGAPVAGNPSDADPAVTSGGQRRPPPWSIAG
jgi:signal peptidase I